MAENHTHADKHKHAQGQPGQLGQPGQGHHHSHSHGHIDPDAGDARIAWAVGVNMLLTVAQVVGGILSGSLALIADALGAVAVIVAGALVILYGWTWVDPAVTLMIAGYILWHVKSEFGDVVRVLMLGARFAITHSTLEMECSRHACVDPARIGHG